MPNHSNQDNIGEVILPITLDEEMKKSYLEYAMSVIVAELYRIYAMVWNRFTEEYYMPCWN